MEKISYEINWYEAPEWAIMHAFDMDGQGYYFGLILMPEGFCAEAKKSGWKICSELFKLHKKTWTKSITFR